MTSSALEIHTGGRAPEDAEGNTAFHAGLIAALTAAARAEGWPGAEFAAYQRMDGRVSIGIRTGAGWPGLEELRAFRAAARAQAIARIDAAEQPPSSLQQGSLL